jgi:hypothetical protein
MDLETRMQVHLLVYRIVDLRILCGSHEDSATVRGKLEIETQRHVRKMKDLQKCSEREAAQTLFTLYEERAKNLTVAAPILNRRPEPAKITLRI